MQDNNYNPNIPYYPYAPPEDEQPGNGGYPADTGQPPYAPYPPSEYAPYQTQPFGAQDYNPYLDNHYADDPYGQSYYGQNYQDNYAYQGDAGSQPPYQQGGYGQYTQSPDAQSPVPGGYYNQPVYPPGVYADAPYGAYPPYGADYPAQTPPYQQMNVPPAPIPQGPNSFERTVGDRFNVPQQVQPQQVQPQPIQPQQIQPQTIQPQPIQPQPIQPQQVQPQQVQPQQVQPQQIQPQEIQPQQVQPQQVQPQEIQQQEIQQPAAQPAEADKPADEPAVDLVRREEEISLGGEPADGTAESEAQDKKPEDIFESFGIDLSDVFAKKDELETPPSDESDAAEESETDETEPDADEADAEPEDGDADETDIEPDADEADAEPENGDADETPDADFGFTVEGEQPSGEDADEAGGEAADDGQPADTELHPEDTDEVIKVAEGLSRSVLAKSYSNVFTENNLLEPEDSVCLSVTGISSEYFLMRNGNQPYPMYNNIDLDVYDGSCVALVADVPLAGYALAKAIGENVDYGEDNVETSVSEDGFEREVLYIGDDAMLPEDMTSLHYLMFSLKNIDLDEDDDIDPEDRFAAVLSQAGLGDIEMMNTSELSHNKRVLLMALSASLNPYIGCLIINDPNFKVGRTDEMAARRIFAMLHDSGKGVVLASTTHLLMGAVANRVVALRSGKVAFDGSYKDFLDTYCLGIMSFSSSTPDETVEFFIQKYENVSAHANGSLVYLIKKHTGELELEELLKDAIENGADSRSIVLDEKTFEIACKEVLRGI